MKNILLCIGIAFIISTSFAADIFDAQFNGNLSGCITQNVIGAQEWYADSFGADQFASMSGYDGGAQDNEDWLITTAMDFDSYSNEVAVFKNAVNYSGPALQLMISTNYSGTGDPNSADWDDISSRATWSGGSFDFVESGNVDISDYDGAAVYLALKYTSNPSDGASKWEIDWLTITGSPLGGESLVIAEMTTPVTTVITAPSVSVDFTAACISNGTADIGYGSSTDGIGWTWASATVSGSGPYTGSATINAPTPGNYYYATRWDIAGTVYYGWNTDGQTNKTTLSAEYTWVVTNPTPPTAKLIITKVVDGTLVGGTPKAVELSNTDDSVLDLTDYTFALFSNGSATPSYTTDLVGTLASHTCLTLCSDFLGGDTNFAIVWGQAPDFITGTCRGNGNDWYAILDKVSGEILDLAGPVPDDYILYLDGYMERHISVIDGSSTFVSNTWTFSGNDAMDGFTAQQISNAIPTMGVYRQIPEPLALSVLVLGLGALFSRRK